MDTRKLDALVVGAGFAGLYMIHLLREQGLAVKGVERAGGVGGTWYWNRYPGSRCDVESIDYSYQFAEALQQGWEWTERYAAQPEILAYAEHAAKRLDLYPLIQFETARVHALHRLPRATETRDGHRSCGRASLGSTPMGGAHLSRVSTSS